MHTLTAAALLFDNDGTLIDSTSTAVRSWTRWAQEYRLTAEEFAAVPLHGRPTAEIVADLLPAPLVAQAVRRVEELELADLDGVVALPGAVELLGALPADRWAVVTSASRALAEKRLASVGMQPSCVVSADDVVRGKPDPEPFLLAASRLGVEPSACVVFEDAPAGLAAAQAAGMTAVAVTTTHGPDELVADLVLDGLHRVRAGRAANGGITLELGN
ncbi:phosphatase [Wenjunlia vitaminophila]|uniref:Phosphatase n=1 Tax=Wenjunlia vitaminophila TaxID=76728 RepID=A0A0T6LWC6_WENVI|nr:HAD-IA family hydrolase [Wenjunlia vitaminophila]KRV50312.1 phosphatase [Wenjunlia vitaminophila]